MSHFKDQDTQRIDSNITIDTMLLELQNSLIRADNLLDQGAPRDTVQGEIQASLCTLDALHTSVKARIEQDEFDSLFADYQRSEHGQTYS